MGRPAPRLLVLASVAFTGWLLSGAGAACADELTGGSLPEMPSVTESADHTDGGTEAAEASGDTTDRTGSGPLGDTADDTADEPFSDSPEADRGTGGSSETAAPRTTGDTAAEAGESVSDGPRIGRRVGDSAEASLRGTARLTRSVLRELAGSADTIENGLERAVGDGPASDVVPGLPGLAGIGDGPDGAGGASVAESGPAAVRGGADDAGPGPVAESAAGPESIPEFVRRSGDDPRGSGAADTRATVSAPDPRTSDAEDSGDLPRHGGSEPTGTVSSSTMVPVPGAAGYLVHRSSAPRMFAQRVDLPDDPTLVVRDAADDPSFSPD